MKIRMRESILSTNSFVKLLPKNQRFHFFMRYFQLLLPFHFSHHPLCSNYQEEVFHVRSWFICRGCAWTYGSTLFALVVTAFFNPFSNFSLFEGLIIVLGITSPTWLGLLHSFQNRKIKDIIRISLGLGWGIALAELWLQPLWIDKIIIFLFIIVFLLIFQRIRRSQTSGRDINLCKNCTELNDTACPGFIKQFEAERLYSREISDFLQQKLSWNEIKKTLQHPHAAQIEQ